MTNDEYTERMDKVLFDLHYSRVLGSQAEARRAAAKAIDELVDERMMSYMKPEPFDQASRSIRYANEAKDSRAIEAFKGYQFTYHGGYTDEDVERFKMKYLSLFSGKGY